RFGTEVTTAEYDEATGTWALEIDAEDGSKEHLTTNVVVAATGLFNLPKMPDIPGIDEYEGELVHTTRWGAEHTAAGKRTAVIGNGSTGVQLLSKIASEASHVDVFVRT